MITLKFEDSILKFNNKELTCQPGAEALMSWVKGNRSELMKVKGVYIISTSDDKTIYIGKAKDLYKRTMEHCKEMLPDLCTEAKRKKDKKWIDAFSPYAGQELELEYIPIEDELDRRWVEGKLQQMFDTVFDHGVQKMFNFSVKKH